MPNKTGHWWVQAWLNENCLPVQAIAGGAALPGGRWKSLFVSALYWALLASWAQ